MTTEPDVSAAASVVAIPADNRWAHAYTDLNAALIDATLETGQEITFYDVEGHALVVVGGAGERRELSRDAAPADPGQVRDRLHTVLGHVPEVMRQRQASLAQYLTEEHLTLDQELDQLPSLKDADLAQTLKLYRTILGPHSMDQTLQDRGSWWHNTFVHGW